MESILYFFNQLSGEYNYHYHQYPIAVPLLTFMVISFIILVICRLRISSPKEITNEIKRELKNKVDNVKEFVGVSTRPRFRKRDKIVFYGRKMLRKIRPGKSKQLARKIARKFLGRPDRDALQLVVREPPAEYMQEDLVPLESSVPTEFLIMLKNLRVFGHFDMPLFMELCKSLDTLEIRKGDKLFNIGETDENIYIVQTGLVRVFITDNGVTHQIKDVPSGEAIISLLSFCDVLIGNPQPYKTVWAKAMEDSVIMKFPVKTFKGIFKTRQHLVVRVVQTVMVRLMRVTFMGLHNYLGLSSELLKKTPRRLSTASLSPTKFKRDINFLSPESDFHIADCCDNSKECKQKRIMLVDPRDDEQNILELAAEKFRALLHLESDDILKGAITVKDVAEDEILLKQDSIKDIALMYVLDGCFVVYLNEQNKEVQLFVAQPGDLIGGLAVLSANPSFFEIRAKLKSRVAAISRETFFTIMKDNPEVVLYIANTVLNRMSPFVRQIDFALDWEHLEAGRALYKQGQAGDSTYIVLNGRLRSVITHSDGHKEVVAEYGKGDLVGIVELLTQSERGTTVMAVRDSELAKLPEGLFNLIKLKHPDVMSRLMKLLCQRILGTWRSTNRQPLSLNINLPNQSNYSTVAIVPISEEVPLTSFTLELHHSLMSIDNAARLTSDIVVKSLGTSAWEGANECHLISWLSQIEDKNRVTLYQCDSSLTVWTKRCIRQADVILAVGLAHNEPSVGKIEKYVEAMAIRTQKFLVLLHKQDSPRPKGTVKWLNMRSWCHSHHHIKASKRIFMKKTSNKIVDFYQEKIFPQSVNIHGDFARLARLLTGTSIGIVLGGGGAKGAAHIGLIKAFQEAGIPIDMVGGVSIGAFIGALFCIERSLTQVTQKAREWSTKMTSKWRLAMDLTYPLVSMFSGHGFNKLIKDAIGEVNIEDMWLPYFTLTTDITDSCARIHTHGKTWRYVRASMSLSSYMPPMCDPHDDHLLLDGGYVNNLPADVMRNRWNIGNIIAIDVGSQYDSQFTNFGDSLSGWSLLLRTTKPFKYFFRQDIRVPNLYDIQSRLSYVSCMKNLEELKSSDYCEYIRPPIDAYQTLNFGSFDEIKDIGYEHGKSYLDKILENGTKTVGDIYKFQRSDQCKCDAGDTHVSSGFTDLAYLICEENVAVPYYSTDEYTQSGYASEPNTSNITWRDELDPVRNRRTGSLSDNDIYFTDSHDDVSDYLAEDADASS